MPFQLVSPESKTRAKSSKLREDERFDVPRNPTKDQLWDHQAHVLTGCAIAALAAASDKAQTHLGNWGAGSKANRQSQAQLNLAAGVFTANVSKNQSDLPSVYDINSNARVLYNPQHYKDMQGSVACKDIVN